MNKALSLIIKILICFIIIGTISLLALVTSKKPGGENGFTETLLDFIDANARKNEGQTSIQESGKQESMEEESLESAPFVYRKGDWSRYVTAPRYSVQEGENEREIYVKDANEMNMNAYGSYRFDMIYGKSSFTKEKYRRSDDDKPTSQVIKDGLNFERQLQLYMEGNTGRRMKVYIDYDSEREDNHYAMQYRAQEDDEVIREINAGEIDIKFEGSKYAVYDDASSKGLGIDMTLRKDKLKVKAFGSIINGETEIEIFRGGSSAGNTKLADYQYVKNTYFQLEPYRRYDNLSSPPGAGDDPYNTLIVFTSRPAGPVTYKPYMVNISSSGFELYMDDQDPYNNLNSVKLGLDRGYYDKLVSGSDYSINFSTGLISLLKTIPKNARIFAVYTLASGGSSDPAVRTDITQFSGKNFVFIKYGYSINEDINGNFVLDPGEDQNGDSRLNLDIYEARSFFDIGQKQLLEDNFKIRFFRQNGIMAASDLSSIGKYSVDYSNGLVIFCLREPFRQLYDKKTADIIYSENQPGITADYSVYNIRADYYREARSFQLKYSNIIPGSARIKVNGRELASSLYSIDYTAGFLEFTDPNDPVIGQETDIEIKYEYLPAGSRNPALYTGIRGDYQVNKNLNIGGSVLFSRESASEIIPKTGSEPEQTLLLETDASLHLGESSLRDLVKAVTGYRAQSIPLEINAYAEYAKSYKKVNTFGKALVDDMESNEEITQVSLSDKDWQLSSMPYNIAQGDIPQTDRGLLYYDYYRDPSNPDKLRGPDFTPYSIPYPRKPGPYNIATGHIADSIQSLNTQRALAFKFDFSSGDYIPIVTRNLSDEAVDFSQLQYVEIWYKSEGGTGEVELFFDIGSLNEDADSSGIMNTEDRNNNGLLDFDPSAKSSEDVGYGFNPAGGVSTVVGSGPGLNTYTTGDGVLNAEDLDRNGFLNINESRIRLPGSITTPYNDTSRLVIDMSDTSWKQARIYLNKASSDYISNSASYEELLKAVTSIRLFLRNRGTASAGTIYIDSIKFISTIWGNIKIDDVTSNSPDVFSLTQVDSVNDSEYRADSFMTAEKETYNSLYGEKTDKELSMQKETAIQIDYDLSGRTKGSAAKKFAKTMDIRSYKTMHVWLNYRDFTSGDSMAMLIGSSDTDYMEYRFPVDYRGIWREMRLKLTDNSSGNIERYALAGNPDLKRISFIKIEVYGRAAGRIWLDDIYLSEPQTQTDSAHWYEGEVKFKRPLLYTDSGTPLFSETNLKYINKGHGSKFSTVGKPVSDMTEEYNEIFSSTNILPNWDTKLDFIAEESETDSLNELVSEDKRGNTDKRSLLFESNYVSDIYAMPSVKLLYKQDVYNNRKKEESANIVTDTKNVIYTPSIILEERLSDFPGGSISGTVKTDLFFKDETIDSNYENGESFSDEKEKRQKENIGIALDYQHKYFFIQPSASAGSHEIVDARGKINLNDTQILSDFENGYHIPFDYNGRYKFVERDKKTSFKFGLGEIFFLSPNAGLEFDYSENNFQDYDDAERALSGGFSRSKSANSSISNNLNLPVKFSGIKSLDFIKSLNLYYSRSIFFLETGIPYEGEMTGVFEERYGVKRVYNKMADPAYNLPGFPPWYFFTGRRNFARGRDFTYNVFNKKITNEDNSPQNYYGNQLKLIDSAGFSSMLDLYIIVVDLNGGINQVSERQSLYGIPQQVVSLNIGPGINLDLMQVFSFGFFRPNQIGIPYHAASLYIGYDFTRNMLITSNIEENVHTPGIGLTFKRDRSSLGLKAEITYRQRNKREYISLDENKRSRSDDIYVENMPAMESFKEKDKGYKFSILYETDVIWLYTLFGYLYTLTGYPIFSIEYSLLLNRYDYSKTTSPEPYDQHLVTGKLMLDLHKNIQGGITGRAALEKYRNIETNNVNREIKSYEIALNFSLLF